jgi:sec-independent protein translocase protein TatB
MLDFGFSEIVLTSAIALIVLGPEKLPKVARQVGNWMGRARHMARQLTEQLEREVSAEELMRETKKSTAPKREITSAPAPFDTSAYPNEMTPTPMGSPAQPLSLPASATEAPPFSADPAVSPQGADWHPAPPPDVKPHNE